VQNARQCTFSTQKTSNICPPYYYILLKEPRVHSFLNQNPTGRVWEIIACLLGIFSCL
jgi:hypothetical protein